MNALDEARKILAARIEAIDAERQRLERALSELTGTSASKPRSRSAGKAKAKPTTRRRTRRRARPGQREDELLASIREHPEKTVSEHARGIGVPPQQLYPILRRLQQDSKIEKADGGFRLAGSVVKA